MIKQYEVYLINLDPTIGHEIKKSRPCVVISPDEMNKYISTAIIAPLTTKSHEYPTRIPIQFKGKKGLIVLDQMRTIDKSRIIRRLGKFDMPVIKRIKMIIKEMLVN